jgi:hypothetical protein
VKSGEPPVTAVTSICPPITSVAALQTASIVLTVASGAVPADGIVKFCITVSQPLASLTT